MTLLSLGRDRRDAGGEDAASFRSGAPASPTENWLGDRFAATFGSHERCPMLLDARPAH